MHNVHEQIFSDRHAANYEKLCFWKFCNFSLTALETEINVGKRGGGGIVTNFNRKQEIEKLIRKMQK
jgi:hypothetical protein